MHTVAQPERDGSNGIRMQKFRSTSIGSVHPPKQPTDTAPHFSSILFIFRLCFASCFVHIWTVAQKYRVSRAIVAIEWNMQNMSRRQLSARETWHRTLSKTTIQFIIDMFCDFIESLLVMHLPTCSFADFGPTEEALSFCRLRRQVLRMTAPTLESRLLKWRLDNINSRTKTVKWLSNDNCHQRWRSDPVHRCE